ncbi:hemagglutinin repeat-containing protein [Bordetella bronchiseptica]|uniref:two-partner secretion domain-containing protein n=1 Tax=Bordetella bronchiseptica TaxID=518 RepID=UPI00081C663B|nr:hemagglutinin repeat-containing protein [Bordetella bronchiseptica]AOB27289.1 adhesin [Bordetella bronchiseptica]AZW44598.1 adhesin [Bordetella bronchiseptica]
MNAFCFRLVHSECRAMYVPVAPRRRPARRGRGGAGRRLRRVLAAAGVALACSAMAAPQRSPSGVPVIDIVAPDVHGLSHNRLRELDVGPPGLVFNNSLSEGRSQLAGYLNRNPGLRQAATAILTEITGTRPSRLHGALEVFGRRADLIVANPNGISVDGLVALNAGRLTLSTGRPAKEGGRLRLDVDTGHIAVAGAGVNTSGLDYFDLVARTVSVDGPVAAGAGARVAALAVVAGRNRFEPANGSVTPLAGSAGRGGSGYAIDGTAAGAMYGARVTLLSSDSGVGVRQRGAVSSPGAITVSSRGEIRLHEATTGAGRLAVDAGGAVAATALASGGAMRIAGEGAVQVGAATSGDALSLHAGGALQAQRLQASGPLDARAQGALRVGAAHSGAGLHVGAGGPLESGTLAGRADVRIDGRKAIVVESLASRGRIAVTGRDAVKVGAAESLAGIAIETAGRAELGTLQSRGALSVQAGGAVALQAAKTDGALRVDGAGVTLGTGSAGQARIDSSAFVHVGALAAVGAQARGGGVEIHARGDVRVGEGRPGQGVAARGDVTIDAANGVLLLRNDVMADNGIVTTSARAAVLEHAGLRSGIAPRARQARPDGGRPSVALRVQDVLFLNGTLRALDEAGAVVPGRHIEVVDGRVRIGDEIAENVHDEESVVSDAVIAARSGAVLVEAGTFVNFGGGVGNGGKQGAGSDLTLRVRGDARNQGYISAGRRGELRVGAALKNEFLIDSAGTQRIEARRIENLGTIQSLGGEAGAPGLVIKAAESVAQAGVMAAERGVEISGRTGQRPAVAASARSSIAGERLLAQAASWDNRGSLALGLGGMRAEIAGRYAERGAASLDGEYAVSAQAIEIAGTLRQGRGATALVARRDMALAGTLGLAGPVRLEAGGALSNTGTASARDRLVVQAASFDNAAGGLLSAGSVDITVRAAARNAGRVLANQDIMLGAASFLNTAQADARGNFAAMVGAAVENRGSLKAGGDLALRAARIDNHGVTAAGHDVGLRSPQLRNAGQVAAGHDIRVVEGGELRNAGRFDARNDIELAVDDYANTGSIHADGDATLALARGTDRDLVIDTPDALPVALGALRVKARSLRVNTEIGIPGGLVVQTQGDIDNRQAIVAGGNLTLASASGVLTNAAGAVLWAGADMALQARRITNGRAASIESGGGMRLAARDTFVNDLGSVRAGGDLRLDAARIENRATLTGHVRHAGENAVGGGGYGFWRGIAHLDYRLRYGNGAAVAAPFYDVALQAGQSRIESGGDLYVNQGLGPGRRGHLRNEGTIQAVGHAYISGDVENRSLLREMSLADYLRTPLAAAIELKVTDSRAALTPAYWSFRTLYELLDYLVGENRWETIWGFYDTYTDWAANTLKNLDLGYLSPPPPQAPPVPGRMPAPRGDADLRHVPRKPVAPAVALPRPLIETRIKYIDQSKFYGSGYFFEQIGYQPDRAARVAGDNYFDTALVREQVRRALGGYESRLPVRGEALVAQLMESAGTVGKALGLKVGVEPTAQQLRQADRDFVWYVDTMIDGQKVLAPRLYLSEATRKGITDQYAGGGALIGSGGDVNVGTNGHDVSSVNGLIQGKRVKVDAGKGKVLVADSKGMGSGIEADEDLDVSAQDIDIEGGRLRGKDVGLKADKVKVATSMRYDGKGRLAARGDGALDAQGGKLHIEAKRLETAGATLSGGKVKLDVDEVKLGGVYEAGSSYEHKSSTPLGSLFAILSSTTETSQSARANHYGTRIEAGALEGKMRNLEIEGGSVAVAHTDVSVAGDATFKAAADFAHAEHEKDVRQLFLRGQVGAGGYEAGFSLGSESGASSHAGPGAASSASARIGWESVGERSASSRKTYRNAGLRLGDGLLAAGGVLDFGGADIDRDRYGGGAEGKPGLRLRGGEVRTAKYVDAEHTVRSGGRVGLELGVDGSVNPQVTGSRLGRSLAQAGDGTGIDGGLMFGQALSTVFQSVMADTINSTLSASLQGEWWNESRNATAENVTHVGGNVRIESGAGDMALAGVRFDGGREADLRSAGALRMRSAESREQRTRDAHSLSLDARLATGVNLVKAEAYVRGTAGLSGYHDHAESERHAHGRMSVRAADVHLQAGRDLVMQGARVEAAQGARVEVGGTLSLASVQDVHDESHTSADWMAAAGAHASTGNGFRPQPVAQVAVSFSHGHDRGAIVAQRTGIVAGGPLSVRVAGDAQLTGADLVSTAGQGHAQVGGRVRAEQLADRRDRDGGSAGVSAPALLSASTRPTLVVSGGGLERDHYAAAQRSVIAVSPGGSAAADGVSGHLQRDPAAGLQVLRDEHRAGGDMAFTLGSVPKFDRGRYAPPRPDTSAPGGSPFSLHR